MRVTQEPTFAEAVLEMMRLSGWTRADVCDKPSDAAWAAAAYIQKCRRKIEAGER